MIFKDIPEFPGYSITADGAVNSTRMGKLRPLVARLEPTGYVRVGLMRGGRQTWRFVHRLVWQTHVGPIPEGLVINHKNGVKNDNRLANLEVVTISENGRHAYRVLGIPPQRNPNFGETNGIAKLTPDIVRAVRNSYASDPKATCRSLGQKHGLNPTTISRIVTRKAWAHLE